MNVARFLVGFNATPANVPAVEPPGLLHEPTDHLAWCGRCDQDRPYDILPGTPASAIPDWAFCTFCGWLLDVDLEESA